MDRCFGSLQQVSPAVPVCPSHTRNVPHPLAIPLWLQMWPKAHPLFTIVLKTQTLKQAWKVHCPSGECPQGQGRSLDALGQKRSTVLQQQSRREGLDRPFPSSFFLKMRQVCSEPEQVWRRGRERRVTSAQSGSLTFFICNSVLPLRRRQELGSLIP